MLKVSSKIEYALRAAMDLARHYDGDNPIKAREIAARSGVPLKFLAQILLELKNAGLLSTTRGPAGGYWLLRPPDMISVAEVVVALEEGGQGCREAADQERRVLLRILTQARQKALAELSKITLARVVEEVEDRSQGG